MAKKLAIKLNRKNTGSEEFERLKDEEWTREIDIHSWLDHQNISKLLVSGYDATVFLKENSEEFQADFMATEFISGGCYYDYLV